jgi:glycosyltransferase involved in cell wall biosynthesis
LIADSDQPNPVQLLRIIARLNIGGPAIQAITLTERLSPRGYRTVLVRGSESQNEGAMDDLAQKRGVTPVRVPWLGRELGVRDLAAFAAILKLTLSVRPQIVHTHAAKAGTLGRMAAFVARVPVTVHTFHGHVLEGYFSPRKAQLFRTVERWLARRTTKLIAVSHEVRADLIRLRIAPENKIEVIPLGFDLTQFSFEDSERAQRRGAFRRAYGIEPDAIVISLVARLVPIKRVDRFLRIAAQLSRNPDADPRIRFVIAGDGESRDQLLASPQARVLSERLTWTRFGAGIADVYAGSDMVALTSDNEGTPVSLIEAHAASLPVVSTDVGGVRAVVQGGVSGFVIPPALEDEFMEALRTLTADPELRKRFGSAGHEHVRGRFALDRLVEDIDSLYRRLVRQAAVARPQ